MESSKVLDIIDRSLIMKPLNEGKSLLEINRDMHESIEKMFGMVSDDYESIGEFLKCEITDKSSKDKYIFYFIENSIKRISDIHWIFYNKEKFKNYTDIKLFNLIKLKDKLR